MIVQKNIPKKELKQSCSEEIHPILKGYEGVFSDPEL